MSEAEQPVWFYLDPDATKKGPVLASALPEEPSTHVWKDGMEAWHPRKDVPDLNDVANKYYYQDKDGEKKGLVSKWELVNLLAADLVTPTTLGWTFGMEEWKPLHGIDELSVLGFGLEPEKTGTTPSVKPGQVWHYEDNYRKKKGPVSLDELKALCKSSAVHLKTKCWKDGSEPKTLEEITELSVVAVECAPKSDSESKGTDMDTLMEISNKRKLPETIVPDKKKKKKKKKNWNHWKEVKNSLSVYVTGLPRDIKEDEMNEHFKKCGIIKNELTTGKPRVKIYMDKDGKPKGDGLVTYLKEESVKLAIELLDDSSIREKCTISVQPAKFEMKGKEFKKKETVKAQEENPVKMAMMRRQAAQHNQKMELSWDDDARERAATGGLRIVVLKHMFTQEEADATQNREKFFTELEIEIGIECEKVGGAVEKLTLFREHPDGVVAIKFKKPSGALKCIEVMDGRFFAKRKVECSYFDGTNYKAKDTPEEERQRLEEFGKWLEEGED